MISEEWKRHIIMIIIILAFCWAELEFQVFAHILAKIPGQEAVPIIYLKCGKSRQMQGFHSICMNYSLSVASIASVLLCDMISAHWRSPLPASHPGQGYKEQGCSGPCLAKFWASPRLQLTLLGDLFQFGTPTRFKNKLNTALMLN